MEPITRRSALALGGVGAAVVLVGGAGLASVWSTRSASPTLATTGAELIEPHVMRSVDGVLDVSLTARPSVVAIGGTTVNAITYNGSLPGPTLWVRPGDTLSVTLSN